MTIITNSLEWDKIETTLLAVVSGLSCSNDLRKMVYNIRYSVSELSKAEVLVRQGKKYIVDDLLCKINNDIALIEEYLIIATLIG